MRYLSVASGIEAASVAWSPLGWRAVGFSEIEPFPSRLLQHHYPDVTNFGDMNNYKEWDVEPFDVLIGGTPCFPAHVLIQTVRGTVPINEVRVGDQVLTHQGRYRRVLEIGSKLAQTIVVRGQGASTGITTTEEHPFYARRQGRVWNNTRRAYDVLLDAPEWVPAKDMRGLRWASPTKFPALPVPAFTKKGKEQEAPPLTPELLWVVGRWVADGWVRTSNRRGLVIIACGKKKVPDLRDAVERTCLEVSEQPQRTATRFVLHNRSLARWLVENFGHGAAGKSLPAWLLGAEAKCREAFLKGYLSGDGHKVSNGWRCNTVSKALSVGLMLLAHSLGYSVSRREVTNKRETCEIEGRVVNEQPYWSLSIYSTSRSSIAEGDHRWGLVRKVDTEGQVQEVFNLEVEEDNSYVADGIVVHNCQSFSSAGLRRGLDDPRGNLALVFCGLVDRFRPRYVIWENVPGALSSSGGRDFGSIVGALVELGYGVCWRVLDAKHFGVAQRRRRVFLVASADGWPRAAAVLFDSQSSLRNPAPRRQRQEELAPPLKKGFGDGRGSDDPLCWWDGGQLNQTADAVLYKKQTMPEKNRFPACFEGEHVRFLMPEEWELLQGFPWGYTDIPSASESARYKALGNSFPVPVIRWLGERIQFVESL